MTTARDVTLQDGRTLRVHDSGAGAGAGPGPGAGAGDGPGPDGLTVLWHHGSPQTGALLEPLLAAAAVRGIRLLSYARPSYGGSTPRPGRNVASAASDVAEIADALGLTRFAVMGASGGGPHALACAALLPGRVSAVASIAGLAPFEADGRGCDGFDWFDGMAADGASLRAAEAGREARARFEETDEFDPSIFTDRDYAALGGAWSVLGADAQAASAAGSDGLVDDDVAFVTPWGFDVGAIDMPMLLVHGGQDRVVPSAHSTWLLDRGRNAELWFRPRESHISILATCPVVMDWLRAAAEH
ncbi:alpha/beta hydrolase [Leifsonia kafniensis]|uniref:Alpha/beta hydrolase n=1 Tax=Leifsonia kafniensis TaxID=475957 RepID=A0ABP7KJC8_9MICO